MVRAASISGFVYVIGVLEGCHKVGWSAAPEDRVAAFDPLLPVALQVVHKIRSQNAPWLERWFHAALSPFRVRGEWFRLDASAISAIKSITSADVAADLPPALFPGGPPRVSKSREWEEFGTELKRLRIEKQFTQSHLADMCKTNQATIANYELGKHCPPTGLLFRISDAIGVNFGYWYPFILVEAKKK